MNIIVCVKQIPDPEIPPAKFRLDSESKRVVPPEGIPPVINPYDAQAVELALRLKEKHGGKITVLSLGSTASSSVVKHALSMGADEGIVLTDEAFEESDSFATAYILTKAIQKIGVYDLILCGRQAADWDEGLVGYGCVKLSLCHDDINGEGLAKDGASLVCRVELEVDSGAIRQLVYLKEYVVSIVTSWDVDTYELATLKEGE